MGLILIPPCVRILHCGDPDEPVERVGRVRHRYHHGEGGDCLLYFQVRGTYTTMYIAY